ncbi:MAG TPA: response regulator transcription factor [Candidatus Limnocylindrales bacterium]|nr:response regulator transcription factor [Candidatus Limnocylindrales bacterium]
MRRLLVYLYTNDPISRAGIASQLRPQPRVRVVDEDEIGQAEVTVVVTEMVDERTMRSLRSLRTNGGGPVVLIASTIDDAALISAVEAGVAGLVRRSEATAERLVAVIESAAAGEGVVPPDLLGRLLHQVGQVQRTVLGPRGLAFAGLAEREVAVLRLVADGMDTSEIAVKLSYSERTVKNVLHDVTSRLHLRNRTHAVAYALRNGLI